MSLTSRRRRARQLDAVALATNVTIAEPLLEAKRIVRLEKNTIVDELNLDLAAGSVPLSDNARFVDALRRRRH